MRKTCIWIFALSVWLAPAAPSSAQTFGQITGKVADSTGGILIGASVMMSLAMGMRQCLGLFLPPVTISLPFKIVLFVLVDGWHLITEALVLGFR